MDTSQHITTADGTRIWYGTVGSGPTLVLCDGLACDGFIWPYVIDHFLEDFQILRWHYRGHGASDVPEDLHTVTLDRFCRDLREVLDHAGVDQAIFAGHSMGVQVILNFFSLFPRRVRALVPMCGSYKRPLDTFHGSDLLRRALPLMERTLDAAPDAIQAAWRTLLPRQFWYNFAVQAAEVNGKLLRQKDFLPYLEHAAEMDLNYFLRLLSDLSQHDMQFILPRVDVPTLIIAGERDTFTPLFRSVEMAEAIDNSELIIVPGGTHVAPLELPDLVTAALDRFFDRHHLRASTVSEVPPERAAAPSGSDPPL